MRRARIATALGVAGAAAALLWALGGRDLQTASAPAAPPGAAAPVPDAGARSIAGEPARGDPEDRLARYGIPPASRGPLPHSLRGSAIDGELRIDADGRFVPNRDALALFEYFFAASGEEPDAVIRGRIALHALERLPQAAAAQVIAVLDRYIAYREEARALAEGETAPEDLARRLQWIRELRRKALGPELAEAFYAEEERVARLDVERWQVMRDRTLDEGERSRQLEAIDARLPPEVLERRERVGGPSTLGREVLALRDEGASDSEIFAVREERYGSEAAERLAALDARRADWKHRLAAYRAERDALLADGAATQRTALDALRERHFEAKEIARVRALEAAGSL